MAEASRVGISALVSAAESGEEITLSRHGRVVAKLVTEREIQQLRKDRELLQEATLVMARFATNTGARTDLDDALEAFGFDRSQLEAELDGESRSSP
ncbi:MAG: type II toxin-antitoxin system Phd/YefM family antitoxin [Micrococcaceae bacterium]